MTEDLRDELKRVTIENKDLKNQIRNLKRSQRQDSESDDDGTGKADGEKVPNKEIIYSSEEDEKAQENAFDLAVDYEDSRIE